MKNKLKFLGIIALVAIIGLTMIGCGDPDAEITVSNDSTYSSDALVTVGVYGGGTTPLRSGTCSRNSSVSFSIGAGDYRVAVIDGGGLTWYYPSGGSSLTFMSGTIRLSYNGTRLTRQ